MKTIEELVSLIHSLDTKEDKSAMFEECMFSMAKSFHSTTTSNLFPLTDQARMLSKEYDPSGAAIHILNSVWLLVVQDIAERYKEDIDPTEFIHVSSALLIGRIHDLW